MNEFFIFADSDGVHISTESKDTEFTVFSTVYIEDSEEVKTFIKNLLPPFEPPYKA